MNRRMPAVEAEIQRMVRNIVRQFKPETIILFGSHARGDGRPQSDVDLLVVMEVSGSKRERQLRVRAAASEKHIPLDVIVTSPGDFAWRKNVVGTVEWPAFHEGKILYARR